MGEPADRPTRKARNNARHNAPRNSLRNTPRKSPRQSPRNTPSDEALNPPHDEVLNPFIGLYGKRQVRHLNSFLTQLRERERHDAHGNTRLFLSDLFVAQLLAFHHPTVRSLRTLDALSETSAAQQVLEVKRLPRSTVSDANKMVDPQLLQPLIKDLAQRVQGRHLPDGLDHLVKRVIAVDGTFLRIVGDLTWALRQRIDNDRLVSKPRLDVQFDVAEGVPRFAVMSGHTRSECNAARMHIEPGRIYIGDKAFFGFDLLRDWLAHDADFLVALNSQIRFTPETDEAFAVDVSDEDDVISDRWGYLGGCEHTNPPKQRLREVIVRRKDGEPLRLLTSLTDPTLTAAMIGELYRYRWQIELFFRWLKSCAQLRHAISHSQNGLSAALYTAMIATLLTAIATGRRPNKYALAAMQFVAAGLTEMDQMQPALERFEREREQARKRREKRRAAT